MSKGEWAEELAIKIAEMMIARVTLSIDIHRDTTFEDWMRDIAKILREVEQHGYDRAINTQNN